MTALGMKSCNIAIVMILSLMALGFCKMLDGNVTSNGTNTGYYYGMINADGDLDGYGQFITAPGFFFDGLKDLAFSYQGQYQKGKRKGLGNFAGEDFDYYGEVDDVPNGKGVGIKWSQFWYVGEWKDGIISGNGTMVFTNGTAVTGQFENSSFVSGSKYQLSKLPTLQSVKDGFYTWRIAGSSLTKQHRYLTLFCSGKPCRVGKYQDYVDGKLADQYFGEISSDFPEAKFHGFGLRQITGQYEWWGNWKDDQPFNGIFVGSDGLVRIGNWTGNSKFQGKTYRDFNRNLYQIRLESSSYRVFLTKIAKLKEQQAKDALNLLNLRLAFLAALLSSK